MTRMTSFSPINPTGDRPGMEPVRLDVLKAAVENKPTAAAPEVIPLPVTDPVLSASPAPVANLQPAPAMAAPLVNKNIRLPADLVEFIDFIYTKDRRMKKQDAYTEALEFFFRPLMTSKSL